MTENEFMASFAPVPVQESVDGEILFRLMDDECILAYRLIHRDEWEDALDDEEMDDEEEANLLAQEAADLDRPGSPRHPLPTDNSALGRSAAGAGPPITGGWERWNSLTDRYSGQATVGSKPATVAPKGKHENGSHVLTEATLCYRRPLSCRRLSARV